MSKPTYTVTEKAAAILQARMSWPQAEACARDLEQAGLLSAESAEAAMSESKISSEGLEAISGAVHEAWIDAKREQGITSRFSEWGEDLMVPYAYLTERAKDLDRATVRAVIPAALPLLREQWQREANRS